MSITATVENDTIKLPAGVHLPDGTKVSIETQPSVKEDSKWMLEFAGIADDMPADLARNLDHYIHGQSRKP